MHLQVDLLEQDTLEVLGLVRSMRNNFAPINRIPAAVLSLIPDHWGNHYMDADADLVALTHVCRGWRKLFTSRPSLWTRLDFVNVDKTRTYIKRSGSLPLEATIRKTEVQSYVEGAILLVIPHIERFKSLTIGGTLDHLQNVTRHLNLPAFSLRELTIYFDCNSAPILDNVFPNGNSSSLRTLILGGVITNLPWRNLSNLTKFKLRCAPGNRITVMRLLNFLESAPQLKDITLHKSIPTSSNVSPSRVVPLPHLKNLTIGGSSGYGILLNHLSIPEGASLALSLHFIGDASPLPDCLPKSSKNLKNISHVSTVNLCFDGSTKFVRLVGPGGGLSILGYWDGDEVEASCLPDLNRRTLRSLNYFSLHPTRSLVITGYEAVIPTDIQETSLYRVVLSRMGDLRTLTLIRCSNLAFVFSLNPNHNPLKITICPNLEELILYVKTRNGFQIPELMRMAKERASRGAKLRSITIVGLGDLLPGKEVFKLREHVTHVEYRVGENAPKWDSVPDDKSG